MIFFIFGLHDVVRQPSRLSPGTIMDGGDLFRCTADGARKRMHLQIKKV